jgi:hypothetical protein
MSEQVQETTEEFACDLFALNDAEREHHMTMSTALFGAMLEARELANGYAMRLPDAPDTLAKLADFIALDRKCCPFFHFGVDVEPHGGPIWLKITGADGVKVPLQAELLGLLPEAVARQIGVGSAGSA